MLHSHRDNILQMESRGPASQAWGWAGGVGHKREISAVTGWPWSLTVAVLT